MDDVARRVLLRQHLRAGALKIVLGTILLFLMITPWVEVLEQGNLSFHMLPEHISFAFAGFLTASGVEGVAVGLILRARGSGETTQLSRLYPKVSSLIVRWNKGGLLGLFVVAILLAYWHIPGNFTEAVLREVVHFQMHASFIIVGVMIFMTLKVISRKRALIYTMALGKAMSVFGYWFLSSSDPIYLTYPASQHEVAGLIMVISALAMIIIVVMYLMHLIFAE